MEGKQQDDEPRAADLDTYPPWLVSATGIPVFSQMDWQMTPRSVRAYLVLLHGQYQTLVTRVEKLEQRLGSDSTTSSKPPSTDSPFKKKLKEKFRKKPGGKKGHPGHRQEMLEPTKTVSVEPKRCPCGHERFGPLSAFHIHQVIEFPQIRMEVTHFVLHEGCCLRCGTLNKAELPLEHATGYGPRLSALIGEVAGTQGNSRSTVQEFCRSVLGIRISKGAVQNVIDRVSEAIRPHYEAIGDVARRAEVNYIDETSWVRNGALMWIWTMVSATVAFFMVHPRRSKEAFEALIQDWVGVLVSDGYGLYCQWVELRQTCLAHLIRTAKGLAQSKNPEVARFGRKAAAELGRLCHMAHAPPNRGQWAAFYARLSRLINENHDRRDDAGKLARRLLREMDSLWVFLYVRGVEPTNNRAERALRFGVLWRKRSFGTDSEKGDRWVERLLTLRQTCRLRGKPTFPVLVDALQSHFQRSTPNLEWIAAQ
jgi:transposase